MMPFGHHGPENQLLVYVIRSGEYAKIGVSRNPQKRMELMDVAMPVAPQLLATFPAGPGLENKLHKYLFAHHARGEWFHWCDKLESLVRNGRPADIYDTPVGSPIYPNFGGRKPRVAGPAQ